MRVAIVHFHLQTGGVTRVIQHACTALTSVGHQVVVLSGEPPQQPLPEGAHVQVIPALRYEERRAPVGPGELAVALDSAAREVLGASPDIWHVHNHCLGKNLALPGALIRLARAGARLLLQPHDFAEDGRPALYRRMYDRMAHQDGADLAAMLYPLAPQIHYAVLNGRDRDFLIAAGAPASQVHLLPNAVALSPVAADISPSHRDNGQLWLYPTRAIRRKNIGELLFWSALAGPDDRFATTQAPQNPSEKPRYRRWVGLAHELKLPVEFEIGHRFADFAALLASSHALVTTSVGEGFGLAFLEPWLVGRQLLGRDLPEITRDFTASGIDLSALYQRLPIPLDWIDSTALRQRMDQALRRLASAYGRPRTAHDLEQAWTAAVTDDRIDFGRLDEIAQETVIRHVAKLQGRPSELCTGLASTEISPAPVMRNQAVVKRQFMLEGYRDRLSRIYAALHAEAPARRLHCADADRVLDRFQAPERLFLLKT